MTSRYIWSSSDTERLLDLVEPCDEPVDVFRDRVEIEARACRRCDAEPRHQRLRAVVARPDGDCIPVEDLRHVVGVYALELEADDARAPVGGRPEDPNAGDLGQAVHRLHDELVLVALD